MREVRKLQAKRVVKIHPAGVFPLIPTLCAQPRGHIAGLSRACGRLARIMKSTAFSLSFRARDCLSMPCFILIACLVMVQSVSPRTISTFTDRCSRVGTALPISQCPMRATSPFRTPLNTTYLPRQTVSSKFDAVLCSTYLIYSFIVTAPYTIR